MMQQQWASADAAGSDSVTSYNRGGEGKCPYASFGDFELLLVCCPLAVSGRARTCVVCHWLSVPLFLDLSQKDSRIMVTWSICDVPVPIPLKLILCPLL
jgi:hypothetical protein